MMGRGTMSRTALGSALLGSALKLGGMIVDEIVAANADDSVYRRFGSAKDALHWASERAARPDLDSSMSRLLRTPGEWRPDEVRDVALTITSLVQGIEPPEAGRAYRCAYGDGSIIDALAIGDVLAHHLHRIWRKPIAQLRALVCAELEHERRRFTFTGSGGGLSRAAKARRVGVSRQHFTRAHWPEIDRAVVAQLHTWWDLADRQMTQALHALGWLRA